MPLLDHFHPPLSVERPWAGMHSTWASTMAIQLNQDQLPAEYFAMPLVTVGGGVQVEVGTFQSGEQESAPEGSQPKSGRPRNHRSRPWSISSPLTSTRSG